MKTRAFAALLTLACASAAPAQIWESPSFFSPRPMDDIGLYTFKTVTRGSYDPTGVVAIWRQSGNLNLGVRAGVGDLEHPGETVLVGAELYGSLNALLPSTGLDLAWNLGAGAVFGDAYTVFSVPFGISLGVKLGNGNLVLAPYVHPRVAIDILAREINGEETTSTEGTFALDLGADVNVGKRLILRLGGSLGDREAFGAGLALRWPRSVSVVR